MSPSGPPAFAPRLLESPVGIGTNGTGNYSAKIRYPTWVARGGAVGPGNRLGKQPPGPVKSRITRTADRRLVKARSCSLLGHTDRVGFRTGQASRRPPCRQPARPGRCSPVRAVQEARRGATVLTSQRVAATNRRARRATPAPAKATTTRTVTTPNESYILH